MSEGAVENLLIFLALIASFAIGLGPVIVRQFRRSRLLRIGVPAQAKVLSVHDTGRRHNQNPVVRITVQVTAADGNDFSAETTLPVSPALLPRYQPGNQVAVKYDPRVPERIAIDSEQSLFP